MGTPQCRWVISLKSKWQGTADHVANFIFTVCTFKLLANSISICYCPAATCKTSKVLSMQAATCLEVCCIAAEMRSAVVRLLVPILSSIHVDVQPHQC